MNSNISEIQRFNKAIAYIGDLLKQDWSGKEENFADAVKIDKIADKSALSCRYFQSFFHRIAGETIGAYINNLRLERAVTLLQTTNYPVKEIANSVGYQNENALFKPFKRRFGITPNKVRTQSVILQKGRKTLVCLERKFEFLPEKNLIYSIYIGNYDDYNSVEFDEQAWDFLYDFAKERKILPEKPEYFGVCLDDSNIRHPHKCRFYACMSVTKPLEKVVGKIFPMTIPSGKYLKYTHIGSYSLLSDFYQSIFQNFDKKLRDEFILERYHNSPQKISENELITEIFVPVVH